jgi:ribosome-associated translation inhibitor RaiA
VFSTLTRSVPDFRHARVTLRQRSEDGTYDVVTCEMTVSLEASGTLRIRTAGPHVYAAINRAVERLAHVVGGEQLDQRRYG